MHIAVIGASGAVGSRVVAEALDRNHSVTATTREPGRLAGLIARAEVRPADVSDPSSISLAVRGCDVVVVATRVEIGTHPDTETSNEATLGDAHGKMIVDLLDGLAMGNVSRLILVGGAGTLKVPPGILFADAPGFPEPYRLNARAQAVGLAALRSCKTSVTWCCICPPFSMTPGTRTGRYRVGGDYLLRDSNEVSAISTEDFAAAVVDEAERPTHTGQVFTVAY